jgi:ATP-dependent Lhr-like helicase
VLYISPLKALAVDVERNLRAPLAGIANVAQATGIPFTSADRDSHRRHPRDERARFLREAADILITTPESLFLLLTSNARERLRTVDTVIIDEIHALVPASAARIWRCRSSGSRRFARSQRPSRRPPRRQRFNASGSPPPSALRRGWSGFLGRRREYRRSREADAKRRTAARSGRRSPLEEVEVRAHDEFTDDRRPATFRPVTIVICVREEEMPLRI